MPYFVVYPHFLLHFLLSPEKLCLYCLRDGTKFLQERKYLRSYACIIYQQFHTFSQGKYIGLDFILKITQHAVTAT